MFNFFSFSTEKLPNRVSANDSQDGGRTKPSVVTGCDVTGSVADDWSVRRSGGVNVARVTGPNSAAGVLIGTRQKEKGNQKTNSNDPSQMWNFSLLHIRIYGPSDITSKMHCRTEPRWTGAAAKRKRSLSVVSASVVIQRNETDLCLCIMDDKNNRKPPI